MMRLLGKLRADERGGPSIEMAIALPVLILIMWGLLQLSLFFEASAGMQNALGQAARYATIYPTPTDTQIQTMITSGKFGLGDGTWSTPSIDNSVAGQKTITVTYQRPISFLFFNGPTVSLTRSKTIYLSS